MFNFSILINDRMTPDFEQKLELSGRLDIYNLELEDSFHGRSLALLEGEEVESLRGLLISKFRKIILLDSSLSFTELEQFKSLFRKAHILGIENIRLDLSHYDGRSDDPSLLEGLKRICSLGASYGIGVLLENGSRTCLSTDRELAGLFRAIGSKSAGLIFNPLEYARIKSHPFFHMFYNSRLKRDIRFLRVADGLFSDGSPTLPAEGNAEVKELASILLARGYRGYFSFIPYFEDMDFEAYRDIIGRFKRLLSEL